VRYTCLVAILIALPLTADAQQRVAAGRNDGPAPTQSRSGQGQAGSRADGRGSGERGGGRQHDQRPNTQRQINQRQSGPPQTGFIGPIGLPPLSSTQTMPWWEQRQIPAWEQKQTPWWERQQTPAWERQQVNPWQTMNPARALLDQQRDARRLARNPRPVHPIHRPGFGRPPIYYPLPPYGYYFPFATYGYGVSSLTTEQVAPAPPEPEPETGFLRLEVEPRHLIQVYVDGLYFGTIDDLGDDIEMRLGVRRIELRAPGYRTLIFDTRIEFDRMVVYRGALDPIEVVAEPPSVPRTPLAPEAAQARQAAEAPKAPQGGRTMYLIPGCYMGNVQPTAAMLPPGCDISKLITMTP
jgi:hypothetical protein